MIKIEDLVQLPTPLHKWDHPIFKEKAVTVLVKRDDLSHPILSGNKFRKLKYNLRLAKEKGVRSLLSFGGAHSNHLYAMAGICKYSDFHVRMIVRGDELDANSSSTLSFASACGVDLIFVDRTAYRNKVSLIETYGRNSLVIPEGGSTAKALAGVAEMVDEILYEVNPDYILGAMGTGGTIAGILSNKNYTGKVIGVSSLKGGSFLTIEVERLLGEMPDYDLWLDYSFGGYAKHSSALLDFINETELAYDIPLEHVYTGKLFYALLDKVKADYFGKGSRIVVYHSGGLQGKLKTNSEATLDFKS